MYGQTGLKLSHQFGHNQHVRFFMQLLPAAVAQHGQLPVPPMGKNTNAMVDSSINCSFLQLNHPINNWLIGFAHTCGAAISSY